MEWQEIGRSNQLLVDLEAIAQNTRALRQLVDPKAVIFGALKADGYGFGAVEVAKVVLAEGADALATADLRDAAKLRQQGIEAPILLYGGTLINERTANAFRELRVMPTITDVGSAERLSALMDDDHKVFIKVDVGLERMGIPAEEAGEIITKISNLPGLQLEGLYTHMHVSRKSTLSYLRWQFRRFQSVILAIEEQGIHIPTRMASSSGVLNMTTEMTLNAVDPGHLIYGFRPQGPVHVDLPLRPALRALRSKLIQVKDVQRENFKDEAPFPVLGVERIGIIPFGTADGLHSVNCGHVLVHGRRTALVGEPSLEHCRVDLTDIPDAEIGDEVVLIGRQGDSVIDVSEVLDYQDCAPAVLALQIQDSVVRSYRGLPTT